MTTPPISMREAISDREAECSRALAGSFRDVSLSKDPQLPGLREHLSCLGDAAELDAPGLFVAHARWTASLLEARGSAATAFSIMLRTVGSILEARLPGPAADRVIPILAKAIENLEHDAPTPSSHLERAGTLNALARRYLDLLLRGESRRAEELLLERADGDTTVRDLYLEVLQPVQYEVGRLWQLDRISVAQEHFCTAATQLVMARLYPRLFERHSGGHAMLTTCVAGELHEIGARMVSDFFEMDGWNTYYAGAGLPIPDLVASVLDQQVSVLAISATVLSHAARVEKAIRAVRAATRDSDLVILVGGRPFNLDPELWTKVGADATAPDPQGAISLARSLCAELGP